MPRQRINPFEQRSAEWVLFDRYRKASQQAAQHEQEAALAATTGRAHRAAAERYAEALRALGHGNKVTPLPALVDYSGEKG